MEEAPPNDDDERELENDFAAEDLAAKLLPPTRPDDRAASAGSTGRRSKQQTTEAPTSVLPQLLHHFLALGVPSGLRTRRVRCSWGQQGQNVSASRTINVQFLASTDEDQACPWPRATGNCRLPTVCYPRLGTLGGARLQSPGRHDACVSP